MILTSYQQEVKGRSRWRYYRGLLVRWWQHLRYEHICNIARSHGAVIGKSVVMPKSLALKANANLVIGDHVCIQTDSLDLRNPVHIGNHVIIGAKTEVLTTSHDIDSSDFAVKNYGIQIEDYVWIPTSVLVLPSCRKIGRGAVIGSGSVVVKNIEPMSVVGGNPAQYIRQRENVHSDLIVESLLGGDYEVYRKSRQ